jgi:hypothetical protein
MKFPLESPKQFAAVLIEKQNLPYSVPMFIGKIDFTRYALFFRSFFIAGRVVFPKNNR